MQAHLYFICPTDRLETVIDNLYKHKNYYYTSLGNSLTSDYTTLNYLRDLILKYSIEEISLVLSENNLIIRDALTNRKFSQIRGLGDLYMEIMKQKQYSDIVWKKNNCHFTFLSHYLNKKIQDLRMQLDVLNLDQIKIRGKIYDQKKKVFNDIYSDLICRDYFSLN